MWQIIYFDLMNQQFFLSPLNITQPTLNKLYNFL